MRAAYFAGLRAATAAAAARHEQYYSEAPQYLAKPEPATLAPELSPPPYPEGDWEEDLQGYSSPAIQGQAPPPRQVVLYPVAPASKQQQQLGATPPPAGHLWQSAKPAAIQQAVNEGVQEYFPNDVFLC